jgi:hypothetical protein
MDAGFLNYLFTAAIGFAIGGVLMSGYFMFTGKQLGFAMTPGRSGFMPLQIALRLVAGPAILVRNVFTMEDDSISLTVAGVALAALWSLGCGFLLLQTMGHG